ncbi:MULTISPECIES: DUF1071 domain-containing protein [unclassified Paenibacillus]|uniref:Sak single strand annealing protein n=1 Tax=unclassified Paenibacillus TaxID=185978 RepID=UPI00277F416A|nr:MULTISPECIES: DUF1071 domain-containing protein [unclassified Paenibacillus]MDQ0896357.1 hypothetical protein [Paenibacillus sp. V4I7]MDQ0914100.1 hypothetical protein [Paenibacillus sp. V4I5]
MDSVFKHLSTVDVGAFIEQKHDSLNYVPWVHAYSELRRQYPDSTYEVVRFPDERGNFVLPYLRTEVGYFVEMAVTVKGDRRSSLLPVMDEFGGTLFEPTAMDINTSIQRCLVKAIALHGLGLYVYAGEESPMMFPDGNHGETKGDPEEFPIPIFKDLRAEQGSKGAYYLMDIQIGEEIIEVAVVGELMELMDEIGLNQGDPCEVFYEERAGKFVATNIRKAS